MQNPKDFKEYRKDLQEALEQDFQRKALDSFAV